MPVSHSEQSDTPTLRRMLYALPTPSAAAAAAAVQLHTAALHTISAVTNNVSNML
jgi:hypothetical protein